MRHGAAVFTGGAPMSTSLEPFAASLPPQLTAVPSFTCGELRSRRHREEWLVRPTVTRRSRWWPTASCLPSKYLSCPLQKRRSNFT